MREPSSPADLPGEPPGPSEVEVDPLFDEVGAGEGFGRRVARGGMMTAASQAVSIGANLFTFPLLSRLLSPDDIGLIAMSGVVTGLASAFVDSGLSEAAVQTPRLSRQQASNLFWCNIGLAIALTLGCVALAPGIAWFFGDDRLTTVVAVSAISLPIVAAGLQHTALLRRRLRFTTLATGMVLATIAGQAVAVGLALQYGTYWALVWRLLTQSAVATVFVLLACHWVPNAPRLGNGTRPLIAFGSKLFGSRLVFQISMYADTALLGWISSPAVVGLYDRAFRLLLTPIRQINGPLGGVMLPTLSRCQDQPKPYRTAFFSVVTLQIAATAPLAAVVVGAPDWVVAAAMGKGWEDAIPLFRLVGVGLVLSPLFSATNWLFTSQGRAGELFKWQTIDAGWRIFLLALGAYWGVYGVVGALVVRLFTMPHAFYWALGRGGPVGLLDYLRYEGVALLTTAVAVAAVMFVRNVAMPTHGAATGLPTIIVAALLASTVTLLIIPEARGRLANAWRLLTRRAA